MRLVSVPTPFCVPHSSYAAEPNCGAVATLKRTGFATPKAVAGFRSRPPSSASSFCEAELFIVSQRVGEMRARGRPPRAQSCANHHSAGTRRIGVAAVGTNTALNAARIARRGAVEVCAHGMPPARRRGPAPRHSALVGDLVTALALPADPAADDLARWTRNLDVLSDVAGAGGRERVRKAVLANPSLLAADLELW